MSNKDLPKRKDLRLMAYDYSQAGAYFITICVKNRRNLLGSVQVGSGVLDAPQMILSDLGKAVNDRIMAISNFYNNVTVGKYVVMPNHIHLIISIGSGDNTKDNGASRTPHPTSAIIPQFVSMFKRFTNKQAGIKLWQTSYYDHIIRDEVDYLEIWRYIDENPAKWREDHCYT